MSNNQTSWRRGQSGNPNGRPRRGQTLSEALRRQLDVETVGPDGVVRTRADLIAVKAIELSLDGDVAAIKFVAERLEGRPIATHAFEDIRETRSASELIAALRANVINPGRLPDADGP